MEISKLLIVLLLTLAACNINKNSGSQDAGHDNFDIISKIEDKGKWEPISELKQYNGFYLSNKGEIFGLDIFSCDTFPIESYLKSLSPIPYVDAKTFQICVNEDDEPYAKDCKRVYYAYLNGILFEDGEDMGAEVYWGDLSISGADPESFKYIGRGYAVDKNNLYYNGRKIKWNDSIIKILELGKYIDKFELQRLTGESRLK